MKRILAVMICMLCFSGMVFATTYQISQEKTEMTLKKGDTVTIILEANPTTGYNWQMYTLNPSSNIVLEEKDKNYSAPSTRLMGAPGQLKYTIKAVGTGDAQVQGYYERSWEDNDAMPDYVLNLHVINRK